MENNILSVPILLSVNKKNAITDVWLTASVKKFAYFSSAMLRQKVQHLYQFITLVIIYSQSRKRIQSNLHRSSGVVRAFNSTLIV